MKIQNRSIIINLILFFSLLLAPFGVQAEVQIRQYWQDIVHALIDRGVAEVGSLNLHQLLEQAATENLTFVIASTPPPSHIAGSRASAWYDVSSHTVHISAKVARLPHWHLARLELHEALGALGYNDHNFQITNQLETLRTTKDPLKREELKHIFGESNFAKQKIIRVAGGSSVGGGGDDAALTIKEAVINRILAKYPDLKSHRDFMTSYPNIAFEPVQDRSVRQVTVSYKFRSSSGMHLKSEPQNTIPGVTSENGYQELISIYFPMGRWEGGGKERARMLSEIVAKIVSLFQEHGKKLTRKDQATGCGEAASGHFSYSEDASIKQIKIARSKLKNNCNTDLVGAEVMAPALSKSSEPLDPGNYYFICAIKYDGHKEVKRLFSAEGTRNALSFDSTLKEGDTLDGTIIVDGNGDIEKAIFISHPPDDQSPIVKKQTAKSKNQVKVELSIHGKPLEFGCVRMR